MNFNEIFKVEQVVINEYLKKIDKSGSFVLWSSRIHNLGTNSSDIDIYYLSNKNDTKQTVNGMINNINIDLEIIPLRYIKELFYKCENNTNKYYTNIHEGELKLLLRLRDGFKIIEDDQTKSILTYLEKIDLDKIAEDYFTLKYHSHFEDTIQMYNSKLYDAAFYPAMITLNYSFAVYLAKNRFTQTKYKWFYKAFEMISEDKDYILTYQSILQKIDISKQSSTVKDLLLLSKKIARS